MTDQPLLPPKKDVALALIQTASSVYVHLDPRGTEVLVPAFLKKQPQLVLQIGLNMAVPIPDLDVGDEALSCTLSFNRRPEYCYLPWQAIFGLVGEDGRGMIWPESVPSEVATQAAGRRAGPGKDAPTKNGAAGRGRRPNLRLADDVEGRSEERAERTDAVPPQETQARAELRPADDRATPSGAAATDGGRPGRRGARTPAGGPKQVPSPGEATAGDKADAAEQTTGRRARPPYLRVVK